MPIWHNNFWSLDLRFILGQDPLNRNGYAAMAPNRLKHRRIGAIIAGAAGTLALAFTATMTLGGFSAAVTTAGGQSSATVVLKLSNGTVTCDSTGGNGGTAGGSTDTNTGGSCGTTLDAFGGTNVIPGGTSTSTITITNIGTVTDGVATVTPAACTAAARPISETNPGGTAGFNGTGSAAFCGQVWTTIQENGAVTKCLFPAGAGACPALSATNTLATLGTSAINMQTLAAGANETVTIKTELNPAATNSAQGLKATVPLTWTQAQ